MKIFCKSRTDTKENAKKSQYEIHTNTYCEGKLKWYSTPVLIINLIYKSDH